MPRGKVGALLSHRQRPPTAQLLNRGGADARRREPASRRCGGSSARRSPRAARCPSPLPGAPPGHAPRLRDELRAETLNASAWVRAVLILTVALAGCAS